MFLQNILRQNKKQSGFTLIELLIVIGIIAILAAAVIITITPGQRLAEARDGVREGHLNVLQISTYLYVVDNGDYPTTITTTSTEICNTNTVDPGDCAGHGLIDLSMLTLATMPVDPHGGVDSNGTGYFIAKGSIILTAPKAETRTIAIGASGGGSPAWACGDNITDTRDDNVYSTVEIDTQCWMAENLAYLPSVVGPETGSTTVSYYYVYGYNGTDVATAKSQANYTTYGVLYNHPAALTACPDGWSLPTDTEQHELSDFLATGTCSTGDGWSCDPAGAKLAGGFSLWTNGTLRNHADFGDSGFDALPGGNRFTNGTFGFESTYAVFWSSTAPSNAYYRYLYYDNSAVYRYAYVKASGFSVRCLRD